MNLDWDLIVELFGFSLTAALLAGMVCPLVGCFLYVRRTSFYGIALPQFAAAGVAFGFAVMPWWVAHIGIADLDLETALEDTHEAINYHLAWAAVFTFGALGVLALLGRRGGSEVSRVAGAFAIASAATVLFAHSSPTGETYVQELLRGEILAIGLHELETIAVVLGVTFLCIVWLHRDLTLVSYDRESALVMGKRVVSLELLLLGLTGLTVSAGTLTVGPIVLFGLLVLPPIAAHSVARSMISFFFIASACGVFAVVLGTWASFQFDWPLGPAVVVAAACALPLTWAVGRRRR